MGPHPLPRILLAAAAGTLLPAVAMAGTIRGVAIPRQPLTLSPQAAGQLVFEAVLIDSALADAPARELGRFRSRPAGSPPFRFAIRFRDRDLSPQGRYSVRATLRLGERLLYTTDTFTPVLDGGPSRPLQLELVRVAEAPMVLQGMVVYLADAASLELCASGERLPLAMEADYLRLERAYLRSRPAGEPGRPLLVTLEGLIAPRPSAEPGQPPRRTVVVERFLTIHPGRGCPPPVGAPAAAPFESSR